ncbi:GH92 family glycosyl hydrolase [Kitasatospora sp. A2-31]|uniref:GH92 family glycosyl hydrolase n=1 Tax=Kitasatospora sp. A2-31 TaxID=2916414 RepID=UPI001EEE25C4|nr:GH92 family glycosyl hydrolase [Kitasatospora sp. A2-31]MCG6499625.1 GH92 family glycosyl hydrolase [Kitasatospora sp. A2-31]
MHRSRHLPPARAWAALLLGVALLSGGPGAPHAGATGPQGGGPDAAATPATSTPAAHVVVDDPAGSVNPYVGTRPDAPDWGNGGAAGNTFPGASAPFGMLQWSPDTATYQHGGYAYDDPRISGFSLTHISGAGCGDYGTTPFMPVLDHTPVPYTGFAHADERIAPGSYEVALANGIRVELAATRRTGIARFTYPAGHTPSLTVDAGRAFNDASGEVTIGERTISGHTDSGGFCGTDNRYRIYFHAEFDRPFSHADIGSTGLGGTDAGAVADPGRRTGAGHSTGVAPTQPRGAAAPGGATPQRTPVERPLDASGAQAVVSFATGADSGTDTPAGTGTAAGRTVTARVGISFVSLDGARANLAAEQRGAGLERIRAETRAQWNRLLARIAVDGGTPAQRRILYTALYHALLHPGVFSDADGRYLGFDGHIRTARPGHTQYADYSGWDVYRSQIQLVALIAPDEAADIAQSLTDQAATAGYFDRWTLANGGTGVMVGDPLPAMAASVHAFGATGFDAHRLLRLALDGSHDERERPGHRPYGALGFVPEGTDDVWGPAATTLEYTSADFALAQLAARLGDFPAHQGLLRRSANWRNLVNADSRHLQPRRADHSWPSFRPEQSEGFVEGSAAQYTWMVPYNHRGLFDAMGGNEAAAARLDAFFTELNAGGRSPHAYLGNEPSLNTPWAYAYAGRPHRTQDVVRRALTTLFADTPGGEPGNDDLGEMSAWAVWAALGMYPQAPGRAELVLASPLFPRITVYRGGSGRTIDVSAPGASESVRYVHALRTDGRFTQRPWVSEDFVRRGGTLAFTLAADPDPAWGADPADAPPSFDVGPAAPATGPLTTPGHACLSAGAPGAPGADGADGAAGADGADGAAGADGADGVPVRLTACTGGADQRWTAAPDGTLRTGGGCLDVTGGRPDAGTPAQLWTCNGTGAQQWWPRPDGSLLHPPSGRCLTATAPAPALHPCDATNPAQHFSLPH